MSDLKITMKLQNLLNKYKNNNNIKYSITLLCKVYSILINNPMFLKDNPIIMRVMYEKLPEHIENLNKYNINTEKITLLLYRYADLVEFILNENIH
jgi:hypothetical protein